MSTFLLSDPCRNFDPHDPHTAFSDGPNTYTCPGRTAPARSIETAPCPQPDAVEMLRSEVGAFISDPYSFVPSHLIFNVGRHEVIAHVAIDLLTRLYEGTKP